MLGYVLRFIGCLLCVCVMLGSVGAVILSMYVVQVTADEEGALDLDNQKSKQTTILYNAYGEQYATLSQSENRVWRELAYMPEDLQHAVVAVEDKDFYTNTLGINVKRTIGAALNMLAGNRIYGSNQGASTLEQQLIKNLTKDDEQDVMRKVREIFRAIGIANRYSKETVMEAYLNTIPLTGTLCGMEAGAQAYFGKSVEELTLAECAALASITKSPTTYNPYTNPENLIVRRNHVLALMRQQGYITDAECSAAQAETITLVETQASTENVTRTSNNSWYTDAVYEELLNDFQTYLGMSKAEAESAIFNDGLRIDTNVIPEVQQAVEEMMYNENDAFPALWREEEVESWIPVGTEITYDENGLPVNPPGDHEDWAIFSDGDIPVYTDNEKTTLKTGTDETGEYICFYEMVRTQASCAILDYNGNIVAIGGGLGEKTYDRGTNRATLPHQTGSTMKPITAYCLALDNGIINYSTSLPDSPIYTAEMKKVLNTELCIRLGLSTDPYNAANLARDDVWRNWPINYNNAGGNGDPMLIYDAVRQSYNTIAVQVGSMVGTDFMFSFAQDTLGCTYLDAANDMDLAPLVLGSQTQGLTAVQLAGAYAIFNTGVYTTPHYYEKVYDYQGNLYFDKSKYISNIQAIKPSTAYIMNRMLTNVLKAGGTASGMAPAGEMEAAAKTGTTSNNKDYTFAALTPYYVTAMWWGYDKPADMSAHSSGLGKTGKAMQKAWKSLMETIQADLPYKEFATCDDVVERTFSTATGELVSGGGTVGYYTEDNMPSTTTEDPYAQAAQDAFDAYNNANG
ncbi:MAG: transglycosylase domain-containing protein [Gemmiger sp.]